MQLSQKLKKNLNCFLHFGNLHKIANALNKKDEPQRLFVPKIIDWKNWDDLNA